MQHGAKLTILLNFVGKSLMPYIPVPELSIVDIQMGFKYVVVLIYIFTKAQ